MILLAEPINKNRLSESKHFFEQAYTERSSLATISSTITQSTTQENSNTNTKSKSKSESHDKIIHEKPKNFKLDGVGTFVQTVLPTAGATLGELAGGFVGPIGLALGGVVGSSIGMSIGALINTVSEDNKDKKTTSLGVSTSIAETLSNNLTQGQTINYTQENKAIKNELTLIDTEINRLTQGLSKGMWQYASYFFTENIEEAKLCSDITQGILLGADMDNTPSYSFCIDDEISKDNLKYAKKSVLSLNNIKGKNGIEFGLPITSNELAYGLPFPKKSFDNLTVLNLEPFGINPPKVQDPNDKVEMGIVRHMDKDLTNTVELDRNLFTSHVFVTGSTGSGKSNTINTILDNCSDIPFLIIEPTKGEYKNILGGIPHVNVFGTNPKKTDLLRINPFSFPDSITLTEHMDKLVDIFNSAWSLYHAMPIIVRSALEHAYESKGWIISNSQYIYDKKQYPDFIDLMNSLSFVINSSSFSNELKGNYTGALTERVKELTQRFYKDIFIKDEDEIENSILFDRKCIIDLSNIGSLKTKSLITGFLFIKLQEYRMEQRDKGIIKANSHLKHITVLEEAHNLLPKITPYEKENETTSDKSVEMISNTIAEMRTYGEAFLIVDQSPEKVDSTAIKNTNTKIIHRLPDNQDCKIAGLSAGAKEQQLGQLATLEKGIAMVFQNGWAEPVLCKIHKTNLTEKPYVYESTTCENLLRDQVINIINNIKNIDHMEENDKRKLDSLLKITDTYEYALQGYNNNKSLSLTYLNNQISLKLFSSTPLPTPTKTTLQKAISHILGEI